jgi:hypothetical protein
MKTRKGVGVGVGVDVDEEEGMDVDEGTKHLVFIWSRIFAISLMSCGTIISNCYCNMDQNMETIMFPRTM